MSTISDIKTGFELFKGWALKQGKTTLVYVSFFGPIVAIIVSSAYFSFKALKTEVKEVRLLVQRIEEKMDSSNQIDASDIVSQIKETNEGFKKEIGIQIATMERNVLLSVQDNLKYSINYHDKHKELIIESLDKWGRDILNKYDEEMNRLSVKNKTKQGLAGSEPINE